MQDKVVSMHWTGADVSLFRAADLFPHVIPGHREAMSPESITTNGDGARAARYKHFGSHGYREHGFRARADARPGMTAEKYGAGASHKNNYVAIFQNSWFTVASRAPREGRFAIVTERWARDAVAAGLLQRGETCADERRACGREDAWSWRPDAGAKSRAMIPLMTVATSRTPGRSRYKRENHRAGNAGMSRLNLW
ncbi:hypothetical protein [Bradyrhizobium sp. HKCCYLR20261]|uniref:hypothetical protein n=1 Tax=Bradyrhizobium sp. HKCCYLR20261 TaxID=3420760 RepID=UPI003EB80608